MARFTFKNRHFECPSCHEQCSDFLWNYDAAPSCVCGTAMVETGAVLGRSATVIGDEMDVTIEHGVCWADGTPRRFRSRTELKAALAQAGLKNPGAVNGSL